MNWFNRLSTANKIAIIGLIISALSLFIGFGQNNNDIKTKEIKQLTTGDGSPIINSTGSSNISITGDVTK